VSPRKRKTYSLSQKVHGSRCQTTLLLRAAVWPSLIDSCGEREYEGIVLHGGHDHCGAVTLAHTFPRVRVCQSDAGLQVEPAGSFKRGIVQRY